MNGLSSKTGRRLWWLSSTLCSGFSLFIPYERSQPKSQPKKSRVGREKRLSDSHTWTILAGANRHAEKDPMTKRGKDGKDGRDDEVSGDNYLQAKAQLIGSTILSAPEIDAQLAARIGERVRVMVHGKVIEGTMSLFDGNRIAMLDDLGVATFVWVHSGLMVTESKST